MDGICRLCCSTKFVNNHIYNEENALYLKMSLYLPIKVARGDGLPQRVCDRCSCRVNDMYQFCNEAIEVQSRLRSIFLSSELNRDLIDVQQIKDDVHSPPAVSQSERGTQTDTLDDCFGKPEAEVKEEPKPLVEIKTEDTTDYTTYDNMGGDIPSDNSEDMSLINLKKKKKKSDKKEMTNGVTETKQGKKRKKDLKEWDILLNALPPGTMVRPVRLRRKDAEQEAPALGPELLIKQEPAEDKYDCCICFAQCYSRGEMLLHYRQHGAEAESPRPPPPPPPPPAARPLRCPRCSKALEPGAWAAHWLRHWERDRRPYRCARCEKTFRDHHQILKHGLTHKAEAAGAGDAGGALGKRFVCDLCPEGFVYMRYLLAHRARAHPEAAARALALRCAECAREFAHLNSLRRHLRAHSGERNFLCSVCGKALSSREHLKFHLRIHAGYKPNICKTCGKGFVKKCNLTLHERVHSGEKPHVCSSCGKAFSQRSTLVIHERYHSGARPYACALCGRGFVAKGLLSMHLKTTCI